MSSVFPYAKILIFILNCVWTAIFILYVAYFVVMFSSLILVAVSVIAYMVIECAGVVSK